MKYRIDMNYIGTFFLMKLKGWDSVTVLNLTFNAGLTVVWAAVLKLQTGLITETSSIAKVIYPSAA